MITLYHGSNVLISDIDLSFSKKGKDFGQGFYLNANNRQAYAMAERRARLLGEGEPILSVFDFDFDAAVADGLNIKIFDDYNEEWAEFVVKNRKNRSDICIHDYDIVIGPIADDTVGVQMRRFMMNYISVSALVEELRFKGDHAVQYFFATERALKYLKSKE